MRSVMDFAEALSFQIRRLTGKLTWPDANFKASRRIGLIEGITQSLCRSAVHRDLRMASDGIAQRQRAMRGQAP